MNAPRPPLMPLDDALGRVLAQVQALTTTEVVSIRHADGRVLARDLVSGLQVPAFDNSAMDGYAVRTADLARGQHVLKVTQRIAAGHQGAPLQSGEAARIFTGAPVPPGADAVVMQEDTELPDGDPAHVRITAAAVPAGLSIRRSGEDVQRGATVLPAGTRLSPVSLGLVASLGCAEVVVSTRPKVALLTTGDELVMPGDVPPQDLPPGAIYNTNFFFLKALLERLGCEVSDLGVVPDQREATEAALASAAECHDLILSSGGVSVGEEDHVKPAVQSLGALDLWQISMKPGKPFAFGHVRRSGQGGVAHFVGLPGNPVSSLVTFHLLVQPLLQKLQGMQVRSPDVWRVPAHFDLPKTDKRREFLRARRNAQGGLDLFPNQSSGVLTSAVWADGLIDNPAGQRIAHGDLVDFIPFAQWLS